jgi:hypothetical protein
VREWPTRRSLKHQPAIQKEKTAMKYKSIIHEMLQQRPQMHEQLRKKRKLLSTLELYARELKTSHEAWKELLSQLRPGSDPIQIASEALEMALKELEDRLPSESPRNQHEAVFLDAAMMFIRRPTSGG